MANAFTHHLFGLIDVAEDNYWDAEISLRDKAVDLDLNTDLGVITEESMQRVDWFIENLAAVEETARQLIRQEYQEANGESRCYQSHHLAEISNEDFEAFVGVPKPASNDLDGFLSLCYLKRLGLYVENPDQFAIVDFTIGTDMTDYILSVAFDSTGAARSVSMES